MDTNVALTISPPGEIVESAKVGAKALTDIINQKPKKVVINGEQYIEFEDWQTLGRFYGMTVQVDYSRGITIGDVHGYEAQASVVDPTGRVLSKADSMCLVYRHQLLFLLLR